MEGSMIDKNTITRENLIELIQSSKTMEDAASKLNIDRRSLLRLREKFGIVHISANVKTTMETDDKSFISEDLNQQAWNEVPEEIRNQLQEYIPTAKKQAEDNLNLMKEVLVNNLPKEEAKPKLEKFNKLSNTVNQKELESLESNSLVDSTLMTHVVIPDCQIKPGVDTSFLDWIGKYIAHIKPNRIICLGDFADMQSLYNYKKESFDSAQYKEDINSAIDAMEVLMRPIMEAMARDFDWKPTFDFTLGNHEHRITKVANTDKKIGSFISVDDLRYKKYGWTVHDFLKPVILDDIAYAHYFTATNMGAPIPSAKNLVDRKHMSCVMGHRQNWEMHRTGRPDGTEIRGLLAGSCYLHDEDYLGYQNNDYSRQIWVLNNIHKGSFNPIQIELKQLKRVYGN